MRRLGMPLAILTALLAFPSIATARIAMEPVREVLREANPDLRACADRFGLVGLHHARLTVDPTGKVVELTVLGPDEVELEPAPASCLASAFLRLRFGSYSSRWVPGGGMIRIAWPFQFSPSPSDDASSGDSTKG